MLLYTVRGGFMGLKRFFSEAEPGWILEIIFIGFLDKHLFVEVSYGIHFK